MTCRYMKIADCKKRGVRRAQMNIKTTGHTSIKDDISGVRSQHATHDRPIHRQRPCLDHVVKSSLNYVTKMPNKLTTAEFIERSREQHGEDKYDYSRTTYHGSNKQLVIFCKEHGEFSQIAQVHLSGAGCPTCATIRGSQKQLATSTSFKKKAEAVHGLKYDYSKVIYTGNSNLVIIICSIHGEFQQRAMGHLNGNGCQQCARSNSSARNNPSPRVKCSEQSIISGLKRVHGDKYDLSEVHYVNTRTKITLICREHGPFQIRPRNAISLGQGCYKCGRLSSKSLITKSTEQFIVDCKSVHGDLFDYSRVTYSGSIDSIEIICREHGIFRQEAHTHLRGHGCPECASCKPLTTEIFIKRSAVIHNNRYDYSETVYTKNHEKVTYICLKHGTIEQIALSHLAGKGCWKCLSKGYSNSAIAWLEYVSVRDRIFIQHALNSGEHQIRNSGYKADGYDSLADKVYEFMGDYHHCNPRIYPADAYHALKKTTCGEVYNDTMKRLEFIAAQGYGLEVIWESEWKIMKMAAKRISNAWKVHRRKRGFQAS